MIRTLALASLLIVLAACGHLHSKNRVSLGAKGVSELLEMAEDGTRTYAFPQYWKRNTLVLDLQGAASAGKLVLKPREGAGWPMRLAFRVRPGTLGLIEVRAEQRMLIPVTREGSKAVDIELLPGVYTAKTEQLTLLWEQ